jgi:hypothetical protein
MLKSEDIRWEAASILVKIAPNNPKYYHCISGFNS